MKYTASWRKNLWCVFPLDTPVRNKGRYFGNKHSAIMWLKRYGVDNIPYHLNSDIVMVVNGYVYSYDYHYIKDLGKLLGTVETKRTAQFAMRNN